MDTMNVTIEVGPECFPAEFGLWLPANAPSLRGILLLTPGSNGDGRPWLEDNDWRGFADQHSLAIVATYFRDRPHDLMRVERYCNMDSGSGIALLRALDFFAAEFSVPALSSCPLFLYGESAGGQFNHEFACHYPERVGAFVVNKGGFYWTHLASRESREVPALFLVGEHDDAFRNQSLTGIYAVNKTLGARWEWHIESGESHTFGASPLLARRFFEKILSRTLHD